MQSEKYPNLGAHMSIAGGYYRAVEAAAEAGCDVVQLFTKNNNQWRAKPISEEDVRLFRDALDKHSISSPISHASYLINLGSPDPALRLKSVEALIVELQRAEQLGIGGVVVHPGAFTSSSEDKGMAAIIESVTSVLKQTAKLEVKLLLENTAGQGSCLGWNVEQLAAMIDGVRQNERLGVCIDTCHAFAAGYNLADEKEFKGFFAQLKSAIGWDRICAFHLNDSKKGLGSRVDRHEHIGEGELGITAFQMLLNHPQLRKIPMYLETEKGDRDGVDLDVINLERLRDLVKT